MRACVPGPVKPAYDVPGHFVEAFAAHVSVRGSSLGLLLASDVAFFEVEVVLAERLGNGPVHGRIENFYVTGLR